MIGMCPFAADSPVRTTFEWGRIQTNADWILPGAVALAIVLFVRFVYRKESGEIGRPFGWLLTTLRTTVFYALLVLYLQPQWRYEREETVNSKAVVLVDTSMSMRLPDGDPKTATGPTRADRAVEALDKTDLIQRLRKTHDVVVARFDSDLARIASLGKETAETEAPKPIDWKKTLSAAGVETRLGQALMQCVAEDSSSTLAGVVTLTDGSQNAGIAPDAAVQAARDAKVPLFFVGLGSDQLPAEVRISDLAAPARAFPRDPYKVTGYVRAQGMAGRMATVELLSRDAGGGANPPGPEKLEGAKQVLLGADGEAVPVAFEVTSPNTGRRTLILQLQTADAGQRKADTRREIDVEIVDRKTRVLLLAGGPQRDYQFLRNLLYRDMSAAPAKPDPKKPEEKVPAASSGFKSTIVDVLLQSGRPGISQEAATILDAFPSTRDALFAYDCIVAIDPDWRALGAGGVDLLEKWVAEQSGGLIVSAGPVNAGRAIHSWAQDPAMSKIRALYPVEFPRSVSATDNAMLQSKDPWPLEFTPEGLAAEYLWLADTTAASESAWAGFRGVFSCFPVRGPKPGATVLARYSDPRTGLPGKLPVYFAAQYYGSGRVFYMGSGETWRLRTLSDAAFETFWTKLIRHVAQGRLLRGSTRGVLLVGQDQGYVVGNTVELRAQLTNAQWEPLTLPKVTAQAVRPDGSPQPVLLRADPARLGTFSGQFVATQEGTYRVDLQIPESGNQVLTRRFQVKLPRLELANQQRNDPLLGRLAQESGGRYFPTYAAAFPGESAEPVASLLRDRSRTSVQTAMPDPLWEETWLGWAMCILCGLLCVEWLIRRLLKLA